MVNPLALPRLGPVTSVGVAEVGGLLGTLATGVVLLAALYAASALLFSDVLPLWGSLSVALSVLIAVALLTPLHRRVRDLVDRRLDRSRYDAQAVVHQFAARISDEVGSDTIRRDMLAAAQRTVQPAHVGLWLAPPTR